MDKFGTTVAIQEKKAKEKLKLSTCPLRIWLEF